MNLKDYILQLDNWIPKNILEKTIMEFDKQQNWLRHKWTNVRTYGAESDVHGKKELDMLTSDNFTYNKELHQYIWKAIERYVVIDKIGGESLY
tara:strand:+ start:514 stop:792 length:279 start_codon:yes stop_codon:yes gene_type:complete